MRPLATVEGVAAPLMRADIDTDQVITRDFCITTDRAGLGAGLFHGWRFREDGSEDPAFVLNRPPFRNPRILVAGPNFACGSSREHAVWSIMDFGIEAVIAASFGSHFYENCFKNGLLPVILDAAAVETIAGIVEASGGRSTVTVSLAEMTVAVAGGPAWTFALAADRREALMKGLDEIGLTLIHEDAIAAFQADDRARRPWVYLARGN